MKKMIHSRGNLILTAALFAAGIAGCGSPPDERLADFAQQTMTEQSRQNQRMADQSQAVVAESHQLAEAAKELVASDATARRDLIAAQQELTSQLNYRQANIDAGQTQLEQERHELAQQRHRDPIVAAIIQNFGLVLSKPISSLNLPWEQTKTTNLTCTTIVHHHSPDSTIQNCDSVQVHNHEDSYDHAKGLVQFPVAVFDSRIFSAPSPLALSLRFWLGGPCFSPAALRLSVGRLRFKPSHC